MGNAASLGADVGPSKRQRRIVMARKKEFNAAQTREHWQKAIREIMSADDRSTAILGGSIAEDCLTAYLRSETIAGEIADNLFAYVIDSFGHKIAAAYVFALIDDAVRQELDLIRKIRNEFAHRILADTEGTQKLTFETPRIKDFCAALQYPNWSSAHESEPKSDPKARFALSVMALSLDLRSAHDIHPLNRMPPPGFAEQLGRLFKRS